MPNLSEQIDWDKAIEFLEKELDQLHPLSKNKARRVDILAKVFLKNGDERWILIHAEIQGYLDWLIGKRVFTSWYRLVDRHNVELTCIVVYVDKHPSYHVKNYRVDFSGTYTDFGFNTYKLLEQKLETLQKSKNPFSIPLEFVWHEIQKETLSDEELLGIKMRLLRKAITLKKNCPSSPSSSNF